jgi:hypothetical protein
MLVSNLPALCIVPIIDFPARLIFGVAMSFLDFALELILLAFDYVEIIISEFAPTRFQSTASPFVNCKFHTPTAWGLASSEAGILTSRYRWPTTPAASGTRLRRSVMFSRLGSLEAACAFMPEAHVVGANQ